jgi:hypothetical protein
MQNREIALADPSSKTEMSHVDVFLCPLPEVRAQTKQS